MKAKTHSEAIDSGEMMESWTEDVLLWALGKGAVRSGREPGMAPFEGGNSTAAVAIVWTGFKASNDCELETPSSWPATALRR